MSTEVTESVKVRTPEEARRLMQRRLRERNAKFAKLSTAEKRVKVAKDVIAQLDAKKLLAQSGCYINAHIPSTIMYGPDGKYSPAFRESDFRTLLEESGAQCSVCALGAMFVTTVKIRNEVTSDEGRFMRGSEMHNYLADLFSKDQLRLIESAFEREEYPYRVEIDADGNIVDEDDDDTPVDDKIYDPASSLTDDDYERAIQFGWDNSGAQDEDGDEPDDSSDIRMRAIMKNIIANGGEFRP